MNMLVRLEWFGLFLAALAVYARLDASWVLFAALILVPDLSMIFYAAGPRLGAYAYNAAHALLGPTLLLLAGLFVPAPLAVAIAMIWLAHIAIDRALGYGLKLPSGFRDTHMGRIGRN